MGQRFKDSVKAQLIAPRASPPWNVSALFWKKRNRNEYDFTDLQQNDIGHMLNLRGLCVFGSGEHDYVRRGGLGHQRSLTSRSSIRDLLEKTDSGGGDSSIISPVIRRKGAEKVLCGFLGEIGLFQDTLFKCSHLR